MKARYYLFIGDVIKLEKNQQIHLFGTLYLKRAEPVQVKRIKKFIEPYIGIAIPNMKINQYESYPRPNKEKGGYTHPKILNPNDWNYIVIEHNENGHINEQMQRVFYLSSLGLTVVFEAIIGHKAFSGGYVTLYETQKFINFYYDESFPTSQKRITLEDTKELAFIKNLLDGLDKTQFPLINKALKDLVSIRSIPTLSPFRILSCFSILELLLTTNKSGSENSLSHQLKTKITLLNNQSRDKIRLENYFKVPDSTTFETVIGLLYQYRNDIAHGNIPDFEKKLSTFKGQKQNILPFLQEVVRKVLLFSIENPGLVTDLKEC